MTRCAILARVSRAEQANPDRTSLPVQVKDLTEYAHRLGYEVVRVFEIPGESAYKDDLSLRPQFQAAIKAGLRRDFEALLVLDASRFARNQAVWHSTLLDLKRAGCAVMVLRGDFDATKEPMRAGLEGIIAQAHSDYLSGRIQQAFRHKVELGQHIGPIPLGYTKGMELVPHEAEAIREVFIARSNGVSLQGLADLLAARGVHPHSRRGYHRFNQAAVFKLLANPVYCGYVQRRGVLYRGSHTAIVTEAEWSAAQATKGRKRQPDASQALLSGIARCSGCEGPIWLTKRSGYTLYREPSQFQFRECPNTRTAWGAHIVDREVEKVLLTIALDDDWYRKREREARTHRRNTADERRRLVQRRDELGTLVLDGLWTRERAKKEAQRIDNALLALPTGPDATIGVRTTLRTFANSWGLLTTQEKRETVRIIFERVWLDTRGKDIRYEFTDEGRVACAEFSLSCGKGRFGTYSARELGVA